LLLIIGIKTYRKETWASREKQELIFVIEEKQNQINVRIK